jgi:hypothetical protein
VSIAACQAECDQLLEDIRKELVLEQNNNDDHDDNNNDEDEDNMRQQQQLEEEEHVLGLRVHEPQPFKQTQDTFW